MFKKRLEVGLCFLGVAIGFGYGVVVSDLTEKPHDTQVYEVQAAEDIGLEDTLAVIAEPPTVIFLEKPAETTITDYEKELIAKVVYTEAGNQDLIGKRLVVDTILNRMDDPAFPGTVGEVIFQKNQFAAPAAAYTDECMLAVESELMARLDYDVLWFCNYKYLPYGKAAYQHGGHYFTWRADK